MRTNALNIYYEGKTRGIKMKKFLLVLTTMLFAIVALAGCGANDKQASQGKVIKVGAT